MPRLLLVRHGATEYNLARMFMGRTDIDLNATGFLQAEGLRDRLAMEKIDVIYSSDLKRTMLTARAIAAGRNCDIIPAPELREIDYGKVEGLKFEEIKLHYPELVQLFVDWSPLLVFPGGESFNRLKDRVDQFAGRLKPYSPEQTVLVVAHSGPLRLLICLLLGIDARHWRQISIDLASLSIVHLYREISILSLLNDTSHLKDIV